MTKLNWTLIKNNHDWNKFVKSNKIADSRFNPYEFNYDNYFEGDYPLLVGMNSYFDKDYCENIYHLEILGREELKEITDLIRKIEIKEKVFGENNEF